MSETQSYKSVTFTIRELVNLAFALDARITQLTASLPYCTPSAQADCNSLIATARAALAKVEAAL